MSHEPAWMGNNDPPPCPSSYATPARGRQGGGYCNCTTTGPGFRDQRDVVPERVLRADVFSALSSIAGGRHRHVDYFRVVYTMFCSHPVHLRMLNFGFMEYCRGLQKQMGFLYKPSMRGVFLIFVLSWSTASRRARKSPMIRMTWMTRTAGSTKTGSDIPRGAPAGPGSYYRLRLMNPISQIPRKGAATTTQMPAHDNGPSLAR